MVETLHVFFADEYLGDLIHDSNGDKYDYIQKTNSQHAEDWNYITNADRGPEQFKDTLLHTRVIPPDRIDCREILRRLGLHEYDPWKIMKISHFITDDLFWASEDMDPDWFWTHHFLASYHPKYPEKTGKPMYSIVVEIDDTSIY